VSDHPLEPPAAPPPGLSSPQPYPPPPQPPPYPPHPHPPPVGRPWTTPPPALEGRWQRLHPASPVVRIGPVLIVIALIVLGGINRRNQTTDLVRLGVVVLVVLLGVISWLVTRWRLADDALQIETGLLRRQSLRFPISQIQAIDIVSPGLARILGLAELRIRMASGSRSTGRLAYMPAPYAEAVRAELLQRRTTAAEDTNRSRAPQQPAAPVTFTPIFTINPGRLAGAVLTSSSALWVYLIVVVLVAVAIGSPSAAGGLFGSSIGILIAFGAATWTRLNGEYRLSLGAGPDGLHVGSGLIQTQLETIPWGRVQALRTIQPILWRPFGWVRIEADVAGHNVSGRQNRAARQAGKALMPVGTIQEGQWLEHLIMPGTPTTPVPPPSRARWKAPLRFPNLSFAANEDYVVTTSGRLRRVTDRVPLAKVQSVRWTEGPVQRRLSLASIHLDTAGRSVFCVARDRDADEARDILTKLPEMCRQARARPAARH
jgi:putative membrane protein